MSNNRFRWFFRTIFLAILFKLSLFAACSVDNNRSFIVNEINTQLNWVELYANPANFLASATNLNVTVCQYVKIKGTDTMVCESKQVNYDVNTDGFFILAEGFTNLHAESMDIIVSDNAGNTIDYLNLYITTSPPQVVEQEPIAQSCGLTDPACNYLVYSNSGERDFYRIPDGSCTWDAFVAPKNNNTEDGSNAAVGTPPTIVINDVAKLEGDTLITPFYFTVTLSAIQTSDMFIAYSTQDISAVAGNDYDPIINGILTIPAGDINASITVNILGDTIVEQPDETFTVNLLATTFGTFTDAQGLGTIIDDDSNAKIGLFNAVHDVGAGCDALSDWDNNLTTQIVNQSSNLWILAKDTLDANLEANITKITLVHYDNGGNTACSGVSTAQEILCTDCGLTDANGCLSKTLSANRALKCVQVLIEGKDANSTSATLSESNASDNFSVRPDRYNLALSSAPYYAGETFSLTANALDINGVNASEYNEHNTSGSFLIDSNETRIDCLTVDEKLIIDNANFTNGVTPSLTTTFTGLAEDLTLSIHEILGNEFSLIDSDDTSDLLRLITPYEVNITVLPYELNVTKTSITASTGMNWIYMADVHDMNITTSATVQANNKQHFGLADFNATCYAKDVNVSFGMTTDGNPLLDMNYTASESTFSDGTLFKNQLLQDINQSMIIPASRFVNAEGNASMSFNVDRNFSNPINPFYVNGVSSSITTTQVALIENNNSVDTDISLYYGRLRGNDIVTTVSPVSNPIYFEVYDTLGSTYTQGMDQTSLSWYVNNLHTGDVPGNIIDANASSNTIIDNILTGFTFGYVPVATGIEPLSITSTVPKAIIHLKTQEWLWYAPSGFGSAYDDTAGSDCTMHPCFQYTYSTNNNPSIIKSGDFNGTVIPHQGRSEYQRKGVKLFR